MPASGERLQGKVRSFRGDWGFLRADGVPGDIFVGLKGNPHLAGLSEGNEVEFELKANDRGKTEAVNVEILMRVSVPAEHDEYAPGARYSGWVRSWKNTWGFINSDGFSGDLFVGIKNNPHLSDLFEGDQVEFEIREANDKREAVEVVVTQSGEPAHQAPRQAAPRRPGPAREQPPPARVPASSGRAQVGHLVGTVLRGSIRSYRDSWGFIISDEFQGDLFVHKRVNPNLGPVNTGDPVEFEVGEDPQTGGQYHAVNSTVLKDELSNLLGQRVFGWVKSFRDKWGLLNSARFDGDIFIGLGANPGLGTLQTGEGVEFEIAPDDKRQNKFQAVQVRSTGSTVPLETINAASSTALVSSRPAVRRPSVKVELALPLEELVGQTIRGTVKSFRDGWGFVNSDIFQGDLFLHQGSNPGLPLLHPGTAVEFMVNRSNTGKLHATSVQVEPLALLDLVGKVCTGTVRKFSGEWGFVVSPLFEGDLFVGTRSNSHMGRLQQGDQIEFLVASDTRKSGKETYEAVNVKVLVGASAPAVPAPPARPAQRGSTNRGRERSRSARRGHSGGLPNPSAMVGTRLTGHIRKFKGGWGFVTSPDFAGDLFIGAKSNRHVAEELTEGVPVNFRVSQSASGKAEAVDVELA